MFSNLKAAIQKVTSKDKKEDEYQGEDIQAVIVLLLEACQIDGETDKVEIGYITNLLIKKFNFTQIEAEENIKKYLENCDERILIFSQIKSIRNEMDHN